MKIIGIIPARYGSRRFPGKPLALLDGKPMIQRVYERAAKSKYLSRIIVATDDVRIMRVVWQFGGEAMLTSRNARSGTDRIAEAAKKMTGDIVVNIQGDEPLIHHRTIDALIQTMRQDSRLLIATCACPIRNLSESNSENVVKVVLDRYSNALYFSRSLVPYTLNHQPKKFFKHLGIYAYRKNFLLRFAKWKRTPLETAESLEQLRALEYGTRMKVVIVNQDSQGVDTKEDLARVKRLL